MTLLIEQLDDPSPHGLQELGGAWDEAILDACRRFVQLDDTEKLAIRRLMTRDRSWSIVGWAEAMATLGVRKRDREALVLALVGLALFGRDFDERDARLVYPLLARGAQLIGVGADDITGTAAELADSVGRSWLLGLLRTGFHALPVTHRERGSGATFSFERVEPRWDPEVELADLLEEEDRGA